MQCTQSDVLCCAMSSRAILCCAVLCRIYHMGLGCAVLCCAELLVPCGTGLCCARCAVLRTLSVVLAALSRYDSLSNYVLDSIPLR